MMVAPSFSTALSRVLRALPLSVSTPRVRPQFALSCEPGLQISRTVVSAQTLLVRVRSIHRWRVGNLQTSLRGLCPPSRWHAWGNPRKLRRWRCFWRRMTPVLSQVSNCSLTAAEPRSNRKGGRLFWRDRSVGPYDDIALEKEQKYAIRKGHDDFKTGVPIECPRNRSRNGIDLANPSLPSPFDARTIRQQYLQLRRYNSENIPELGRVPGAQHTRCHERFGSRRKRTAVAADFVNAYFWR